MHRQGLTLPDFKAHEAEFLPAALSIQAQPVSPAGRWVARMLMLLMVVVLAWSMLGHVDIIVNAQGNIIPDGHTKSISSVEVASVRTLNVKEGQAVKAGEVLIELDTRVSDSERDKSEGDRQTAWLQAERSRSLLRAIDTGQTPSLHLTSQQSLAIDPHRVQDAQRHLQDQWRDYQAKLMRLEGQIIHYRQALPLAMQRAQDYAELAKSNDVSQHAWLEREQLRIELEGQLTNARDQLAAVIADTRKTAQEALNEANRLAASSAQDVHKATVRGELLKLVSPVDGTVQQLTVHTVGGVVPAAQALMQVVPRLATVEMQAFIENKIDAFEYTKYGTIAGKVSHVSKDAIQDEKKGLIYSVRVILLQPTMSVNDQTVALSPGMTGSVEIKTGTRRVIEYVLSPLLQQGRESFHER
jgi:hemolysin D